jgi:SPOR domain
MSVEVIGYRSRKRKDERKRAAKAKKEKILLAVCGVVLLGILAFEGPKTLKKLHGGSAAPAPATVAPPGSATPAAGTQAAGSTAKADSLAATRHMASKDPFAVQLGTEAAASSQITSVAGPAVRQSHFVQKDPFIQQLTFAAPPSAASTTPTPTPGSSAPPTAKPAAGKPAGEKAGTDRNYIVMVASIPLSDGRGAASAEAAKARSQGIASVNIVDSSRYPTLRTGFYAVYSGPYPTLAELQPALAQVRGKGYPSAYTRRLAH